MKYPYKVKYNGKVYLPDTEIPEPKKAKEVTEKPKKAVKGDK